jgi:hypothetical protein
MTKKTGRQAVLGDLEDDTGNIILNSSARPSPIRARSKCFCRCGDSSPMFESATSSLVLFLRIRLVIRQKQNGGYVALLMDIPSNRGP